MFSYEQWANLFLILVAINVLLGMPLLCLLGMMIPASLKAQFFREPYYSPAEQKRLGWFPVSLVTNVSLASMFVWPRLGRKRQISPAGGELSGAYRMALQCYFWVTALTLPLAIVAYLALSLGL